MLAGSICRLKQQIHPTVQAVSLLTTAPFPESCDCHEDLVFQTSRISLESQLHFYGLAWWVASAPTPQAHVSHGDLLSHICLPPFAEKITDRLGKRR